MRRRVDGPWYCRWTLVLSMDPGTVDGSWYCRWTLVLSMDPGTFFYLQATRNQTLCSVFLDCLILEDEVHSKRRQLLAPRNCVTTQKTPILNRKAKTAQILYKVVSAEAILYASHYRRDFPYSQPLAVQD